MRVLIEEIESVKTIVRQQLAALPTEPAVDASEIVEPPAKIHRIDDFDDEVHDEPTTDEMTPSLYGQFCLPGDTAVEGQPAPADRP